MQSDKHPPSKGLERLSFTNFHEFQRMQTDSTRFWLEQMQLTERQSVNFEPKIDTHSIFGHISFAIFKLQIQTHNGAWH